MKTLASVLACLLIMASTAAADLTPAPVVTAGFAAYKKDGAEAGVRAWAAGGPMEKNPDAIIFIARRIRGIEELYGPYRTFRVVKVLPVSDTCQMAYVQADFENGPLFMKFLLFKPANDWRVIYMKFHTEIERIWPHTQYGPVTDTAAAE